MTESSRKIRIGYYQNGESLRGVGRYMLTLIEKLDRSRVQPVFYLKPLYASLETRHYVRRLRQLGAEVRWLDCRGIPSGPESFRRRMQTSESRGQAVPKHGIGRRIAGFEPVKTLLEMRYGCFLVKCFRNGFAEDRLDILHINYGTFQSHPHVSLGARWAGIRRIIATVHSAGQGRSSKPARVFFQRLFPLALDEIICVEEELGEKIVESYPHCRRKIHVIHNAVDMQRPEVRARLMTGPSHPPRKTPRERICLVSASLTEEKGHEVLLQAAARLRVRFPAARYVFAGEGRNKAALRDLAGQLGLSGRIEFTGFVSDMRPLYERCDFIALPSHSEACPLALLEAAHSGKPAIATDRGAVRSILRGDTRGRVVPPADVEALTGALEYMLSAPESALAEMGKNFHDDVSRFFRFEEMMGRTLSLYGLDQAPAEPIPSAPASALSSLAASCRFRNIPSRLPAESCG